MTIFQKMILAPVLSLILYGSFITYSFFEHKESSEHIEALSQEYVPILLIVDQNITLFDKLKGTFKDGFIAKELGWIVHSRTLKKQIEKNLLILESSPHIIDEGSLTLLKSNFQLYYKSAINLANQMLLDKEKRTISKQQLERMENSLLVSRGLFIMLQHDLKQSFRDTLNTIKTIHKQLLYGGSVLAILSMVFLIIVTASISLSTRRSIHLIIERAKELAMGSTDFSKRIERNSKDELGKLVFWFNKLSDKLESDYLKIKNVSITDKLTQLNNRNRTDQFLPSAISNALNTQKSLSVVLIDIDHFKKVNDKHGHIAGDKVLQEFARILKEQATESDYISRWGGEEFLLVWPNIDADMAYIKAENIRHVIERYNFSEVGHITASMGITTVITEDTPESIMKRVDNHLYIAKNKGRNCVVV